MWVPEVEHDYEERIAQKTCQGTLEILQNVPAKNFGDMKYTPKFSFLPMPERNLNEKAPLQILSEDVLVSGSDQNNEILSLNHELKDKLKKIMENCLEKSVGERFDYRLKAETFVEKEEKTKKYQFSLQSITENSRYVYGENVFFHISAPSTWDGSETQKIEKRLQSELNPFSHFNETESPSISLPTLREDIVIMKVSLELWT